MRELVEVGVGQEVEEVRVPSTLDGPGLRAVCSRLLRDIAARDLLDTTGWVPPDTRGEENAGAVTRGLGGVLVRMEVMRRV